MNKKTILITIALVLLLSLSGFIYWKFYSTYSDGNRTGLLQKFSHKGNVFKTYEGELVMNGLTVNGSTGLGSEKFYFSVNVDSIAQKLMNLEGQKVVLHYEQKNGVLFWRGESVYMVDQIKIVGQ